MTLRKPFTGSQQYWQQAKNISKNRQNNWHPSLPPTIPPFLDCLSTQLHVSYFGDLAFEPVPLKYLIEKKTAGKSVMFPASETIENTAGKKYHPFPKWKVWKDTKKISTVSLPKQTGILPGTQCSGAAQCQKLGHLQRKVWENVEGILYFLSWFDKFMMEILVLGNVRIHKHTRISENIKY